MYASPVGTYAGQAFSVTAPTTYAAPVQAHYAAPVQAHYAAPVHMAAPTVVHSGAQVIHAAPTYAAPTYAAPPVYAAQPMAAPYPYPAQPQVIMGGHMPIGSVKKTLKGPMGSMKAAQKQKLPMGSCKKMTNQTVPEAPEIMPTRGQGQTHMIICAIDYTCCSPPWGPPYPGGPGGLDTKFAYDYMHQLAQACGVPQQNIQSLFNQQVTSQGIQSAIQRVGQVAQPGDTILFFYSGHGDHLPDQDGDEEDGTDEALCTLGFDGQAEPRDKVWTRDDDFANYWTQQVAPDVNIIMVADCCHSGSIMDLDKPQWQGFNVASISGCTDTQTSAGTGQGGEMTRALCASVEAFQQQGQQSYGVDTLNNMTIYQYNSHHTSSHQQQITINSVGHMIEWPLVPVMPYRSPMGATPGNPPAQGMGVQVGGPAAMYQPAAHVLSPQPVVMQPQVIHQQPMYHQPAVMPQVVQQPQVIQQHPMYAQPAVTMAAQPMYQQAAQPMYHAAQPMYQQAAQPMYHAAQPMHQAAQQMYGQPIYR